MVRGTVLTITVDLRWRDVEFMIWAKLRKFNDRQHWRHPDSFVELVFFVAEALVEVEDACFVEALLDGLFLQMRSRCGLISVRAEVGKLLEYVGGTAEAVLNHGWFEVGLVCHRDFDGNVKVVEASFVLNYEVDFRLKVLGKVELPVLAIANPWVDLPLRLRSLNNDE